MTEKRFDYVVEACKQILSLTSAGLVLVTTFKDKFYINNHLPFSFLIFFLLSLFSIILSLFCIFATAGTIERALEKGEEPKIYGFTLRLLFITMIIIYCASLSALGYSAYRSLT